MNIGQLIYTFDPDVYNFMPNLEGTIKKIIISVELIDFTLDEFLGPKYKTRAHTHIHMPVCV